jgi:hypothetical protein
MICTCLVAKAQQAWIIREACLIVATQGSATGVRFADAAGQLLVSAGADGVLRITDRRLDAAAAATQSRMPLTALDAHEDGMHLAVGTAGAHLPFHAWSLLLLDNMHPRRQACSMHACIHACKPLVGRGEASKCYVRWGEQNSLWLMA